MSAEDDGVTSADLELALVLLDDAVEGPRSFSTVRSSDPMAEPTIADLLAGLTVGEPPRLGSFASWLSDQRGRADAVGRLADAVAAGKRTGHAQEAVDLAMEEWHGAQARERRRYLEANGFTPEKLRAMQTKVRQLLPKAKQRDLQRRLAGLESKLGKLARVMEQGR